MEKLFSFKSFSFLMFPVGEIFVETTAGGGQQKKAFLKIHRKTPVLESFLNKVAGPQEYLRTTASIKPEKPAKLEKQY